MLVRRREGDPCREREDESSQEQRARISMSSGVVDEQRDSGLQWAYPNRIREQRTGPDERAAEVERTAEVEGVDSFEAAGKHQSTLKEMIEKSTIALGISDEEGDEEGEKVSLNLNLGWVRLNVGAVYGGWERVDLRAVTVD